MIDVVGVLNQQDSVTNVYVRIDNMNFFRILKAVATLFTLVAIVFFFNVMVDARETIPFNDGWSFALVEPENYRAEPIRTFKMGDQVQCEKTGETRPARLPHDWAIEQAFDKKYNTNTGALPWRGVGVYSKTLFVDSKDADKRFVLSFDGCMAFPEVFVNGTYAGGWDYGYLGFQVDVTPFLRSNSDNTIDVRCDTREHHSRWYPGAGLYRSVQLLKCSRKLWLPEGSVFIKTPEVEPETTSKGSSKLSVEVTPEVAAELKGVEAVLEVADPTGTIVYSEKKTLDLVPNSEKNERLDSHSKFPDFEDQPVCFWNVSFDDVALWDVDSPRMYTATVKFSEADGETLDELSSTFGFRKIEWTVDDGFYLNGRRLQLKGVDLHHDQGIIGACAHPTAIRRQLSIMRDMGVNAIRTSHNPNSSAFMDACDEMGFIVWDELFDKWDGTAGLRPEDDFYPFAERQARRFVRRDRNRPSVCAWSVGNEIWQVERNEVGSSNPDDAAKKRVAWVHDVVKKYDPTRLTGMGCFVSEVIGDYPPKIDVLEPLDISGWNYGAKYREARKSFPKTPLVYTESASAFSTRGYYDPSFKRPDRKDVYDNDALQVDSFDLISANGPRDIPDVDFERMEKDRYVAGEFVWTGFDYLGEPAPFEKEAKSSYFGVVDLCGTPKDRFYLYRSYWNDAVLTVHILPHWNWEGREGQNTPVYVYTNGDSAELFLNGKSLGRKSKDTKRTLEKPRDVDFDLADYYWIVDKYRLRWENVPYEPGVLEVVAYKEGAEIGRAVCKTAGKTACLRLIPEKERFENDDDLVYVNIEAVDADGTLCPTDMMKFSARVEGSATLVGISNGNPIDYDSFADSTHSLFYGKATLVLRSGEGGQKVRLVVSADGLPDSTLEIEVQ